MQATAKVTIAVSLLVSSEACGGRSPVRQTHPSLRDNPVEFRLTRDSPHGSEQPLLNRNDGSSVYVERETILDEADISDARVITLKSGDPAIEIFFTSEGAARLQAASRANIGRTVAIIVNGQVAAAVPIRSELKLPSAVLVSNFSVEEADEIVRRLK